MHPPEARDLARRAKRLVVLPAGPLADIPFELLLALSGDPQLEGKPVVQAASATVYLECLKRRREKPETRFSAAVLGDPLYEREALAKADSPE